MNGFGPGNLPLHEAQNPLSRVRERGQGVRGYRFYGASVIHATGSWPFGIGLNVSFGLTP